MPGLSSTSEKMIVSIFNFLAHFSPISPHSHSILSFKMHPFDILYHPSLYVGTVNLFFIPDVKRFGAGVDESEHEHAPRIRVGGWCRTRKNLRNLPIPEKTPYLGIHNLFSVHGLPLGTSIRMVFQPEPHILVHSSRSHHRCLLFR